MCIGEIVTLDSSRIIKAIIFLFNINLGLINFQLISSIVFELTLWVILILGVRKLWQDMRRNINNVFRNIQYSMLITLCTVDIIQGFMRFEPRYLLGTYAINVYAWYLYQWAEFINISCWINFIIQMNVYHDPHQFKLEMIQKTRNKEKWFMVFYAFAMVLYLVPAVVMHIMMYIASWENWDPFDDVFCKFHSPPLSPCTLKTK